MENVNEKINHLISLIPEDYDKRDELIERLDAVEEVGNVWMNVVTVFADVIGTEPMIAAYTSSDDSWMKDVQTYWQQFDKAQ
jgi:hypothetical protein